MRYAALTLLLVSGLSGCPAESEPSTPVADTVTADAVADATVDSTATPDAVVTDAAPDKGGVADLPEDVSVPEFAPADTYCEQTRDAFCSFYIRCGRMAVDDEESCRQAFDEACNARYEPLYVDLADRGLLKLSTAGIAACTTHLETVACDQQIFDLDGPCGDVWAGQAPVDAPCGPGLESFICDATSTCVLGLDFCGTCRPLAADGETCDTDRRCRPDEHCEEGACVPRIRPGQPCDPDIPCILGSGCVDGTCQASPIAGLGEPCGGQVSCQYKAECVGGTCVGTALQGEACGGTVGCASGWCDGATCQTFGATGGPCASSAECLGACSSNSCSPITWSCL